MVLSAGNGAIWMSPSFGFSALLPSSFAAVAGGGDSLSLAMVGRAAAAQISRSSASNGLYMSGPVFCLAREASGGRHAPVWPRTLAGVALAFDSFSQGGFGRDHQLRGASKSPAVGAVSPGWPRRGAGVLPAR